MSQLMMIFGLLKLAVSSGLKSVSHFVQMFQLLLPYDLMPVVELLKLQLTQVQGLFATLRNREPS